MFRHLLEYFANGVLLSPAPRGSRGVWRSFYFGAPQDKGHNGTSYPMFAWSKMQRWKRLPHSVVCHSWLAERSNFSDSWLLFRSILSLFTPLHNRIVIFKCHRFIGMCSVTLSVALFAFSFFTGVTGISPPLLSSFPYIESLYWLSTSYWFFAFVFFLTIWVAFYIHHFDYH